MTIIPVFLFLASCVSTAPDVKKPRELAAPAAQPPAALEKRCARPLRLAEKAMTAGEVERAWGKDRAAQAACAARHAVLIAWRRKRDAGLAGEPLPAAPRETPEPAPAATEPGAFRNPFAGLFGAAANEE